MSAFDQLTSRPAATKVAAYKAALSLCRHCIAHSVGGRKHRHAHRPCTTSARRRRLGGHQPAPGWAGCAGSSSSSSEATHVELLDLRRGGKHDGAIGAPLGRGDRAGRRAGACCRGRGTRGTAGHHRRSLFHQHFHLHRPPEEGARTQQSQPRQHSPPGHHSGRHPTCPPTVHPTLLGLCKGICKATQAHNPARVQEKIR